MKHLILPSVTVIPFILAISLYGFQNREIKNENSEWQDKGAYIEKIASNRYICRINKTEQKREVIDKVTGERKIVHGEQEINLPATMIQLKFKSELAMKKFDVLCMEAIKPLQL